ncbi:copper/silver efflux system outer membrane protein CusC [Klebsiella pneumoniae]|uniref:Copper/silver efflux system outer membrane protein CusC n=1 Tax=Klebsiella pneumoniae TaxID=573 RepID=A0A3S4GI42_KLEPN|nr:copper/silver efflux system outer membrane protein CusC [Klebsiella pneumoniae]
MSKKSSPPFKEVADTLALRQSLADQIAAQERYLASLNITLQRATALYRHGAVSYIEVLSAQRDIFTTRQTLLELNYSRQANEITLFTALGGRLDGITQGVLMMNSLSKITLFTLLSGAVFAAQAPTRTPVW